LARRYLSRELHRESSMNVLQNATRALNIDCAIVALDATAVLGKRHGGRRLVAICDGFLEFNTESLTNAITNPPEALKLKPEGA